MTQMRAALHSTIEPRQACQFQIVKRRFMVSFQPYALYSVANWVIVLKCLLRLAASACILLLQALSVILCGSMMLQLLMLTLMVTVLPLLHLQTFSMLYKACHKLSKSTLRVPPIALQYERASGCCDLIPICAACRDNLAATSPCCRPARR